MNELAPKSVLVLGLGKSGVAMARWCARRGAKVRVWDSRADSSAGAPGAAQLDEHVPDAVWVRGALDGEALAGIDCVAKSPGLAPRDVRIAPVVEAAAKRGIPVVGELAFFAAALAELERKRGYAPQVIAITGTNGKTTTTAITALLVERAGRRVATAGNIGPTILETLIDALDGVHVDGESALPERAERRAAPKPAHVPSGDRPTYSSDEGPSPETAGLPDVWVLELSSFQLEGVDTFEPSAAAILNITEDHLDWHGSLADYAAAKGRIFGKGAVIVANRDDAHVEALVEAATTTCGKRGAVRRVRRVVVRFGVGVPTRAGDFGIVEEHGMAWLVRAQALDDTARHGRAAKSDVDLQGELFLQRLMPADALRIRGRHNAANALAALALTTAIGCPLAPMLHGLREYRGEPHRVEWLANVDGIDAFDDSKGTNVGATVAALEGLGLDRAPAKLVVILGGDGKGQDFAPLVEPLVRHARAVATLGRDAAQIEAAIEGALAARGIAHARHSGLEAATRWAFERAQPGDAVLLSPACASLDMFRDYAHRAQVFKAAVDGLLAEAGVVAV